MTKKALLVDNILYLGLLIGLISYNYSVIQRPDLLVPSLPTISHHYLPQDALLNWNSQTPSDPFSGKELIRRLENDRYIQQSIAAARRQPPVLQFNAELAVLPAAAPVVRSIPLSTALQHLPVNSSSATGGIPSSASSSSLSFNAAAEALGDLFMSDIYLQGDLDLDEITAVVGLVSKEDMDVQRLVDVLWSQDIDLGAGRETFEYPIHPPKNVHQKTAEAKLDSGYPPNGHFTTFPSSQRAGLDQFFVDDETGEVTSRTAASNDTRRPFTSPPTNTSQYAYPPTAYGLPNSTVQTNQSTVPVEDQQLQSLIEALNSLNSSTLQAAVNQGHGQSGKVVEEQWLDVESVISQPRASGSSFLDANRPYDAAGSAFNNATSYVSGSGSSQTPSNGSMQDLNTFDLFSMFMDPPKNWTLPTANANSSDFFGGLSAEYNSSDASGYRQNSPVGVVPDDGNSADMFGSNTLQILPSLIHEGPFDLSAFAYGGQTPLVPQTSQTTASYSTVPLMDQTNSYTTNWNMSDWHGVGVDMSTFPAQSQQNTTGNGFFGTSSAASGGNDAGNWKLLADFQPNGSNITDAFLLLDDASKLQLLDLDANVSSGEQAKLVPVEVKQEEVDPWTEHVNYATNHNHTYAATGASARRRGRSMESREGSEDDHQSFSGSTGSGSGSNSQGQSRQSRDDRAASELRLPVTAEEIISMPVEEFNGYISGQVAQLHNDQIQLMKDIRRRGKNKVAAQNCRRRKIDNMSHLEREIMDLQSELKQAQSRHGELTRERDRYRAALRSSVIQDGSALSGGSSTNHQAMASPSSVIVMSGGSMRGLQRQDSGSSDQSDKPLRKRKRHE